MRKRDLPRTFEYTNPWRAAAILVLLIASLFTLSLALPYQPYERLEVTSMTETVCTGGVVDVQVERNIIDPALGGITRAEASGGWVDVATDKRESLGAVPIEIQDSGGAEVVSSPVVREAPKRAGEYRLYIKVVVYGFMGVVPRVAIIETTSDSFVTVEDCERG